MEGAVAAWARPEWNLLGCNVRKLPVLWVSVLLACPLPAQGGGLRKSTGDPQLDGRIDLALEKGTARLVQWLPFIQGDRKALVLFAALEGGADKENPLVAAALEEMIRYRSGGTYGTGILLMLYKKHGGVKARDALQKAAERLLSWQGADGGWGYGEGRSRSDASNTQYALLGLRAAFQGGVRIPRRAISRAVDYLLRTRGREGGFGYVAKGNRRGIRDTMTAGTLGSLAICREIAGKTGLGKTREKRVAAAARLGIRWLERAFPASLPRGAVGMNRGYFLYALERAMVLLGMEKLGKDSWYAKGARYLVDQQDQDGSWSDDPITTSFAVLFLARTFRPLGDVTQSSPEELLLRLRETAGDSKIVSLAGRIAQAGLAAVPACLKILRGPSAARRRAAALALEKITGLEPVFDPAKAPTLPANQEAARVWERWWMEHRGKGKVKRGRRSG